MIKTPLYTDHLTAQMSPAELKAGLLDSLLTMAWAVEARDPYTGGHLWRVSQMARLVAKAAGLPPEQIEQIAIGGFLHDLGKISIPDQILTKRAKLTDDEFSIIKTHPEAGWRLLNGHPLASLAESAIRAHHEMPNGRGYPLGLIAADIPLDAKIVGLCDAFDAMTSTRPYRAGMPISQALGIIEQNLSEQFDAHYGRLFIALGKSGAFDHIVSHSDEGIPLQHCSGCGPIVVIQRQQVLGEHTYCHSCHAQFSICEDATGNKYAAATGQLGQPADLIQSPDKSVIGNLVERALNAGL